MQSHKISHSVLSKYRFGFIKLAHIFKIISWNLFQTIIFNGTFFRGRKISDDTRKVLSWRKMRINGSRNKKAGVLWMCPTGFQVAILWNLILSFFLRLFMLWSEYIFYGFVQRYDIAKFLLLEIARVFSIIA